MLLYYSIFALPFTAALVLPQEKEIPDKEDVVSRIHFGDEANIRDYPFFAGLNNCGAVIISSLWLLTAAICVKFKNQDTVWVGGETRENSETYEIHDIFIHRKFTNKFNDNIALIQLVKPLQFSNKVKPVVLPRPQALNEVEGQEYEFITRGTDETGKIATHLQKSKQQVFSTEQCLIKYHPDVSKRYTESFMERVNNLTMCTVREKKLPGISMGDSGSPLVQGNVLVGLGLHLTDELVESYLVKVEYYLPWIEDITGLKI